MLHLGTFWQAARLSSKPSGKPCVRGVEREAWREGARRASKHRWSKQASATSLYAASKYLRRLRVFESRACGPAPAFIHTFNAPLLLTSPCVCVCVCGCMLYVCVCVCVYGCIWCMCVVSARVHACVCKSSSAAQQRGVEERAQRRRRTTKLVGRARRGRQAGAWYWHRPSCPSAARVFVRRMRVSYVTYILSS